MKPKTILLQISALCLVSLAASFAGDQPAISKTTSQTGDLLPGTAAQPISYFYTGKPYDSDLCAYLYSYRNYNQQLCRWTAPDPSGFPDGTNNRAYLAIPTTQLDPNGLITVNGGTVANGQSHSSSFNGILGGLFNSADYSGDAYATANGDSGSISMRALITGYNTFSWFHTIDKNATIDIGIDGNGNLTYTPQHSFGGADGVVGAGLSFTVEGAGTKALTFHIWGAWALSATSVSGIGANATGGTISFAGASMTDGPVALGTFNFLE